MTDARFAHAGLTTTRLGFGLGGLMRTPSAKGRRRLLDAAFDSGVRHFDVARMYGLGAAERELGRFARGRREQVTIATKFGIETGSAVSKLARLQAPARALLNAAPALRRAVRRRGDALHEPRVYDARAARLSLDTSLRAMGVDYVDVLFVHDPRPQDDVAFDELQALFGRLADDGKIRAWGVAQDAAPGFDAVGRLGPSAILQVRDSIFERAATLDRSPRFTFGVLGPPHDRIRNALQRSPSLLTEWSEALQEDPLADGVLARLLLAEALDHNADGAVLFNTTRVDRVPAAADVVERPPSGSSLTALRTLVAAGVPTAPGG